MTCENCGSDKFSVARVSRNKRLKDGVWIYDGATDTRFIICKECGVRFLTETQIIYKINYENLKIYLENVKTKEKRKIKEIGI